MLYESLGTVFVDLETTGSSAGSHRITEIAIVEVTPDGRVSDWSTLINPGREIPLQISALTGIHNAMVADAPHFEDIWPQIWERLDGRLFVAHNVHFDYGFLRHAFDALGQRFRPRRVCTVRLSRQLYPAQRRHHLDALVERFNLTCEPRHRALTDARALWEWCVKVSDQLGAQALRDAVTAQLDGPPLPQHLSRGQIDCLPEGPGVYRFKGADDALLYVGKSRTLRKRVRAHLAGAARGTNAQKMVAQTRHIETTRTAGELGALLLEATTIKRDAPLFNRRLRRHAEAYTLQVAEDSSGYLVPRARVLDVGDQSGVAYGLFRRAAQARKALAALADEHQLCRKILGLERGPGSCFALQIGRCRGACVKTEPAVAFNLRLLQALGSKRVADWPFGGAVAIGERSGGRAAWHVVDRWCHLGTAALARDLPDLLSNERVFDIDIYRILRRYLDRAGRALEVMELEG